MFEHFNSFLSMHSLSLPEVTVWLASSAGVQFLLTRNARVLIHDSSGSSVHNDVVKVRIVAGCPDLF